MISFSFFMGLVAFVVVVVGARARRLYGDQTKKRAGPGERGLIGEEAVPRRSHGKKLVDGRTGGALRVIGTARNQAFIDGSDMNRAGADNKRRGTIGSGFKDQANVQGEAGFFYKQ
jgi:hypothetical protein